MTGRETASAGTVRQEEDGPPCKRCAGRIWEVDILPKGKLRWLLETVFAAPDVWIFQSESGGWPAKEYERWTCLGCGRRVRV